MFKRYYYNIYSCDSKGVYIISSLTGKQFFIHSCHIRRIEYKRTRYCVVTRKPIDFNDPIKYELPCKIKGLD